MSDDGGVSPDDFGSVEVGDGGDGGGGDGDDGASSSISTPDSVPSVDLERVVAVLTTDTPDVHPDDLPGGRHHGYLLRAISGGAGVDPGVIMGDGDGGGETVAADLLAAVGEVLRERVGGDD